MAQRTALERKIRVLIAKPGLDGHDRGAKVVARALRDAGMEVIYTGLRQSPEQVVEAAIQEDVDVVGLSVLSGAHMTLLPRVVELLRERDAGDIAVLGGGIIPDDDAKALKKKGIHAVFGPGTPTQAIIDTVRRAVAERRGRGAEPAATRTRRKKTRTGTKRPRTRARRRVGSGGSRRGRGRSRT